MNDNWGPIGKGFSLIDRKNNWLDITIKAQPANVRAWNVYVANSCNQAYGNFITSGVGTGTPTKLFQVAKSGYYRSRTFINRKLGLYGEGNKGLARALFNVEDFIGNNSSVAKASVTLASVNVADTVTIQGVDFVAAGVADLPNQIFSQGGTDTADATSLAAAINHAASQALITAAIGGGLVVTAVADGAVVTLYAGSTAAAYDAVTVVSSNGVRLAVSSGTLDFVRNVPFDDQMAFYRLQEVLTSPRTVGGTVNTGVPIWGPVHVVPPAHFFTMPEASYTFGGTAPANTGCSSGNYPAYDLTSATPPPLHIVLPRGSREGFIRNNETSGTLLYSLGLGLPMYSIGQGETVEILGRFKEIVLAAAGASPMSFSVQANLDSSTSQ
jgi:hypothetical protein